MEETMEIFSSTMRRLPTCIEYDTDDNILKSRMLLWENSGRGNFIDLNNVSINNNFKDEKETCHDIRIRNQCLV